MCGKAQPFRTSAGIAAKSINLKETRSQPILLFIADYNFTIFDIAALSKIVIRHRD
jgi:hypothetical protein